MNIEEFFKRSKVNYSKLKKYGFKKDNDFFVYSQKFFK